MPARPPERYRITWDDLHRFLLEEQAEEQMYIRLTLHTSAAVPDGAWWEVRLVPWDTTAPDLSSCTVRAPATVRREAGLPGQALHAVASALSLYRANGWLWPLSKARKALGEDA